MRKAAILAGLIAALSALFVLPSVAAAAPKNNVLVFTKTAGAPPTSIQDGVTPHPRPRPDNGFPVTVTQDAGAFTAAKPGPLPRRGLPQHHRRRAQRRPGGRVRGLHPRRRRLRRRARGRRDRAGLAVLPATSSAPKVAGVARREPAARRGRRPRPPVDRDRAAHADADRGVVQLHGQRRAATSHVLATLDENSFTGGTMGFDHPVAWCQDYAGGRSWYTGLGHSIESYREARFQKHLLGGIQWAAGVVEGDCGATVLGNYEKVTLNDDPGEPMSLAVLPDGRVLHNTRGGEIRLYDPATGASPVITTVPRLPARRGRPADHRDRPELRAEQVGLHLLLAAAEHPGRRPGHAGRQRGRRAGHQHRPTDWDKFKGYNQLSRFKFVERRPRTWTAPSSRSSRAVDRGICCHVAGKIKFDGRATCTCHRRRHQPGVSDGFTPINDSPTRNPASTRSARRPTPTTCAASCCGSRCGQRHLHDPGGQPVPAAARRRPGPRSS